MGTNDDYDVIGLGAQERPAAEEPGRGEEPTFQDSRPNRFHTFPISCGGIIQTIPNWLLRYCTAPFQIWIGICEKIRKSVFSSGLTRPAGDQPYRDHDMLYPAGATGKSPVGE